MKSKLHIIGIVLVVTVFTAACKKSDSSGSSNTGQSTFFTAVIGGQTFTATTAISGTYSAGNLEISGQAGTAASGITIVKLELTGFQAGEAATFSAGASSGVVLLNGTAQYTSKDCSVVIKSSSLSFVNGTFTFTATDGSKITGSFNEPYTGGTPQGAFLINEPVKRVLHLL